MDKLVVQECTKDHLRIHRLFNEFSNFYEDLLKLVKIRYETSISPTHKTLIERLENPAHWLVHKDSCWADNEDKNGNSRTLFFDIYLLADHKLFPSRNFYHFDSEVDKRRIQSLNKAIKTDTTFLHKMIKEIYKPDIHSISFYHFKEYPVLVALRK